MRRAFLDSGAIYALADANDADHASVLAVYGERRREFVTSEPILLEAFSLITKRLHKRAIEWIGALRSSPRVHIVPATPELIERGWQRCLKFTDKEWDSIDCTCFVIMQDLRLLDALSLDRHFAQAGFKLLVT